MTPERWREIERLYESATALPPIDRLPFVAAIADSSLRREVESLLDARSAADSFFDRPVLAPRTERLIGQTLSHYKILDKLGEGGMGVVYKALDTHLDRPVAIKMLRPDAVTNAERKRRFVQEAKAASALNHPNIIAVYDVDVDAGTDFIAMEYVPGKTLDQLTPRKG